MSTALQASFSRNGFSEIVHSVDKERISHATKQTTGMLYNNLSELRDAGLMSDYVSSTKKLHEIDAIEVTNTKVQSRINLQTGLIQRMQEVLVDLRSQVTQFNTATQVVDIKKLAEMNLKQLALTLNTISADGYEFGGATADIPPIEDVDAFIATSNIVEGKATRNYTRLISSQSKVKLDLQREINLEFDATHPAFQKFTAALHLMKGLTPDAPKDSAVKMFDDAYRDFESLIVNISFNDKILSDAKESLATAKTSATFEMETKFKANIPDLVAESESIKLRLTSAMSALSNDIKRAKLMDFMR